MWVKQERKAQIFKNGGSQAVRLPSSVRFAADVSEVFVRREGDRLILEPATTWPQAFVRCLGAWDEDIPRPDQGSLDDILRSLP